MDTIEGIRSGDGDRSLNTELQITGIVANLYKSTSNDNKDVLALLEETNNLIGIVKDSVDVSRKVIDGVPIVLGNKKSEASKTYMNIAKIIMEV